MFLNCVGVAVGVAVGVGVAVPIGLGMAVGVADNRFSADVCDTNNRG